MELNNEHRPETLKQMIGNADAVNLIQEKFVDGPEEKRPHTILLTGVAGTGKTTLGRIIARLVGALLEGETEEDSRNYKELDNANDSGKDYVKEIKRNMKYKPVGAANARVYMMDECHMLSPAAKEALLKPTEKPPRHVYFILATSEPTKLNDALKRRALHIEMKPFDEEDTAKLLKRVAKKEGSKIPPEVMEKIHVNSMGSPGMSLKILEALIHLSPKKMKSKVDEEAKKANAVFDLCTGLFKKLPWVKIAKILRGLKGQPPESVRRAVLTYCTNQLLKKDEPVAYSIMDAFREPFYTSPYEQLVMASYECLYADEED